MFLIDLSFNNFRSLGQRISAPFLDFQIACSPVRSVPSVTLAFASGKLNSPRISFARQISEGVLRA